LAGDAFAKAVFAAFMLAGRQAVRFINRNLTGVAIEECQRATHDFEMRGQRFQQRRDDITQINTFIERLADLEQQLEFIGTSGEPCEVGMGSSSGHAAWTTKGYEAQGVVRRPPVAQQWIVL